MITKDNLPHLLSALGFQRHGSTYSKTFGAADIKVNLTKGEITYPVAQGLIVNERQTCNLEKNENFVVLECVCRLLMKGYKPEHIELEPKWQLGRERKSGRADILVRDQQGAALLIIECKTAGREFDSAWKDTLVDGAQLFSYVEQEKATRFVCLYASVFDEKTAALRINQRIISVKDNDKILSDTPNLSAFSKATNTKERFKVWQDTYQQEYTETGIFEDNIQPYQIGKSKYTLDDDTKALGAVDIKGAYHRFRTILRKHNVSRRENAFEVLVNLFLCKIVDELENPDDLKFYWKGIAYDNYFDLIDRLQALYKIGMERFLGQDIVYISNAQIDDAFWPVKKKRSAIREEIKRLFRELKFYKGLDFEFIKVFNKTYFDKNAKILLEIIQMWQGLRLTDSAQNQFLGDMFEYFLDNGIKQSEGQFFTPVPICKFIVSSLPLEQMLAASHEPLRTIDYACGSGHFLTEYAAQLPPLLQNIKHQSDARPWHQVIYGIEKEDRLAKVAKVSAFMYGFEDIQILDADALVRHAEVKEAGFQVLIANPPFAVEDFLLTIPEEERERYTLMGTVSDLGNKNVQCFFLERAQQLLSPGGVMGVIVPNSILANSDGIHIATREILLKHFDFVAITELGGKTFGKTSTNTVILFLRRKRQRPDAAVHFYNRVQDFFDDWMQESKTGGGEFQDADVVRDYCTHVRLDFEIYQSLLMGVPNDALLSSELFRDYHREFDASTEAKKIHDNKKKTAAEKKSELETRFVAYCRAKEQDKLYYFLLAKHNPMPVLLIKSPVEIKAQQRFLGYEWRGAKGREGVGYIGGESVNEIQTPLFDAHCRDNADKLSFFVRRSFEGQQFTIPAALQPYATQVQLVDLLEFGRVGFDKVISLNVKTTAPVISSKWSLVKLADVCEMRAGKFVSASEIKDVAADDLYPCYGGNGLRGYTKTFTHDGTYPLIGRQGALCGNVCLVHGKFHATEHAVVISPSSQANTKWLYYKLHALNLNQYATGVAQPGLSVSRLKTVVIELPSLEVQQQIVAECEMVDKAAEMAKASASQAVESLNHLLEQLAGTTLDKIANIAMHMTDGIDPQQQRGFVNYIGLENIEGHTGKLTGDIVTDYQTIKSTKTCFKSGDVLYGKLRPNLNKVYLAQEDGVCSTDIYVLRFASAAHAKIYSHYLRSHKFNAQVLTTVSGQQLPRTSWKAMSEIKVPVFTTNQQIVQQIETLERNIANAQAVIDAAPAQKEAVLQKYS